MRITNVFPWLQGVKWQNELMSFIFWLRQLKLLELLDCQHEGTLETALSTVKRGVTFQRTRMFSVPL